MTATATMYDREVRVWYDRTHRLWFACVGNREAESSVVRDQAIVNAVLVAASDDAEALR